MSESQNIEYKSPLMQDFFTNNPLWHDKIGKIYALQQSQKNRVFSGIKTKIVVSLYD
jgi:hypothetical protein